MPYRHSNIEKFLHLEDLFLEKTEKNETAGLTSVHLKKCPKCFDVHFTVKNDIWNTTVVKLAYYCRKYIWNMLDIFFNNLILKSAIHFLVWKLWIFFLWHFKTSSIKLRTNSSEKSEERNSHFFLKICDWSTPDGSYGVSTQHVSISHIQVGSLSSLTSSYARSIAT